MPETCNSKCQDCQLDCDHRITVAPHHEHARVGKVLAIASGKGGVGKSFVTANLAIALQRLGYQVGILDADVTGPSIPMMFGVHEPVRGNNHSLLPNRSRTGIQLMSANMLLRNPEDPVVWRGAMISNLVKQFWTNTLWDVDYLLIDMPPGTGDVPLTVYQSVPVDGVVIVVSPQELVEMIVTKAYRMAVKMDIPVLGLVENMSYVMCPNCNEKFELFGPSQVVTLAHELNISHYDTLPINPEYSRLSDTGQIEAIGDLDLSDIIKAIK